MHSSLRVSSPPQIRSVVWNADDSRLISCGTHGAVYEWSVSSGKRETECVLKSCSYNCVTVSPDAKIIFAVGSDHTLKEIADSSVSLPLPAPGLRTDLRDSPAFRAESVVEKSLREQSPFFTGQPLLPIPLQSPQLLLLPEFLAQGPA